MDYAAAVVQQVSVDVLMLYFRFKVASLDPFQVCDPQLAGFWWAHYVEVLTHC